MFRALAERPIGVADYGLAAAQGVVSWLALSREQSAGLTSFLSAIFLKALSFGSVAGIASLLLLGAIYSRLSRRVTGQPLRNQVIHVLAYGGLPVAASLGLWLLTALIAGETAFVKSPGPETEGFVSLILTLQLIAYFLLVLWSYVLQIMGLSEIQGVVTRNALWIWALGQLLAFLALLLLAIILSSLLPPPG